MNGRLELPLNKLRPIRLRDLQETALCLSYDNRGIDIFVQRIEERAIAVFLTGEYAMRAFQLDRQHDWKGLAVPIDGLLVDARSALDSASQSPPLGSVVLAADGPKLQVAMKDSYGFENSTGLALNFEVQPVSSGVEAAFTRWSFRLGPEEDAPVYSIDAAKMRTST